MLHGRAQLDASTHEKDPTRGGEGRQLAADVELQQHGQPKANLQPIRAIPRPTAAQCSIARQKSSEDASVRASKSSMAGGGASPERKGDAATR